MVICIAKRFLLFYPTRTSPTSRSEDTKLIVYQASPWIQKQLRLRRTAGQNYIPQKFVTYSQINVEFIIKKGRLPKL